MRSVKCAWAFCPGALRYQSFRSRARGASRYRHRLISSTMKLRPIDVKSLSPKEREELRKISKAIPLVADKEPLDVIFEDDNFLVVNKPDFVKMHPSHRFQGGSLLNRAIGHCGTIVPHILHRLDMHTTGVVMFAKKKELCHPISEQFSSGMVKKEYLLIADGCPTAGPGSQFAVEAPVQRHSTIKFARVLGCDRADSKPARTLYKVLDSSKHTGMSLMHIFPETGRTHQIRLHAAHVGFPIVGDSLYNPRERNMYKSIDVLNEAADDPSKVRFGDQNPLRGGLKLHAWRISLENPITKLPVTFCAPPASHFEALMKWANLKIPLEASIYCDVARDVARDDGC